MLTGAEYREWLRDGRQVFIDGRASADVTVDPMFDSAVSWIASSYDSYYSDEPGAYNPIFRDSRTKDDLRERVRLILEGGGHGSDFTIGTTNSSILGLLTAMPQLVACDPADGERIGAFLEHCRSNDIRLAEAITDTKGNRSKRATGKITPITMSASRRAKPVASGSAGRSFT